MTTPATDPPTGEYVIGVMTMHVEGRDGDRFERRAAEATAAFDKAVTNALGVRVDLLAFEGPHLTPDGGAYAPLDFLRVAMTEKLDRHASFLLVVTEVDLAAASAVSYAVALPSPLTNVAVVSAKRLGPEFRGEPADEGLATRNLTTLLLHSFGHLLNLPHSRDPSDAMYAFAGVEDLPQMGDFSEGQRQQMRRALPREAHERTTRGGWRRQLAFSLRALARSWGPILSAVARANPLRLVTRLPTVITAALSVVIVVFFSPEAWDVGSTVELWQLAGFSVLAVLAATAALYRTFAFGPLRGRGRVLAESTVVTAAAVALSLLLTVALLFAGVVALTLLGTATIFPRKLMETWPTVDPAVRVRDHVKVCLFIAGLSTLAGSLGGRADRKDLARAVLFVDEET